MRGPGSEWRAMGDAGRDVIAAAVARVADAEIEAWQYGAPQIELGGRVYYEFDVESVRCACNNLAYPDRPLARRDLLRRVRKLYAGPEWVVLPPIARDGPLRLRKDIVDYWLDRRRVRAAAIAESERAERARQEAADRRTRIEDRARTLVDTLLTDHDARWSSATWSAMLELQEALA